MRAILTLAVVLGAVSGARAQYVLRPTDEVDGGYTVSVDRQPTPALGRSVAVPAGTTITIRPSCGRRFSAVLIGPAGIMTTTPKKSWSARLDRAGGYRLEWGPESALYPLHSAVDFVVVPDTAAAPTPGTALADQLYAR